MKGSDTKRCSKCYHTKHLDCFRYTNKKRISRRAECMACEKLVKQKSEYKEKQKLYSQNRRKNPLIKKRYNELSKNYGQSVIGRANRLFLAAKHRAKISGLEFTITQSLLEVILYQGFCQKTGIPFDFSSPNNSNFNPYAPSVDRKNPFLGYTVDNIQVVCNAYNIAKNQMTDEQFINFCKIVWEKNK